MRKMTAPPPWAHWRLNPASATPATSILFAHQSQLPKLPIPALNDTIETLITSTKPLATSSQQWQKFANDARAFGAGFGSQLQKRLELHASKTKPSWIAEWWDTDAYMAYRDSVVCNVSYYYGFQRFPQAPPSLSSSDKPDPAYVAASIAVTALEFRKLIITGQLEPEKAGKDGLLCMESYKWAFNACRVPASPSDYAVKISESAPEGAHFVVIHRNRFWKIPIQEDYEVQDYKNAISDILQQDLSIGTGVGILTGVDRDLWTEAYGYLSQNPENAETIRVIEQAAFTISLDEAAPTTTTNDGLADFSTKIWKAGKEGSAGEGANRWWDKPLQWVVFSNGETGFIGEHSCMDGTPTARMNDFISRRLITDKPTPIGTEKAKSSIVPEQLSFNLDATARGYVARATQEFSNAVGSFDLFHHEFNDYGKEFIKTMKTSPDGWVQMMFQLAYYMTHEHPCGTYEAAQVRRFHFGRTETIRTCTSESLLFTHKMLDSSASVADRKKAFLEAVKVQGGDARNASVGMGIDRHIYGLKHMLGNGEEKAAAFLKDPLLVKSSTWNMSTSQIYIERAPVYGWGPVVEDGYGLPYMIHNDKIQLTVTCKTHMPGKEMLNNLVKAGRLIKEMMLSANDVKL